MILAHFIHALSNILHELCFFHLNIFLNIFSDFIFSVNFSEFLFSEMNRFILFCCAIAMAIGQQTDNELLNSILLKIRTTTPMYLCSPDFTLYPGHEFDVFFCGDTVKVHTDQDNKITHAFVVSLNYFFLCSLSLCVDISLVRIFTSSHLNCLQCLV